jgi:hypothetical protein
VNRRTSSLTRIAIRLGAGVIILLALGGPTPGYVGTCDASGGSTVADPAQFCTSRKTWECARDYAAHRIDMGMYNACALGIDAACAGFNWTPGCAPSPQLADACISALSDMSRVGTPTPMIEECYTESLCGGAPLTTPDDGI